jgi:hypothetical protein
MSQNRNMKVNRCSGSEGEDSDGEFGEEVLPSGSDDVEEKEHGEDDGTDHGEDDDKLMLCTLAQARMT